MQYSEIQLHGLTLRYADAANVGAPLVLIGGIGMALESGARLAQAVAKRHIRSIGLELPGAGSGQLWRLADYADLLAEWLTEIGIEQAVVMGVSWGGALAQEFARRHPSRLSHLVLAATTPGMVMLPGTPKALSSFLRPKLYRKKHKVSDSDPESDSTTSRVSLNLDFTKVGWQMLAAAGWTSIHWLHRIQQPVLIIQGTDDELVRPANARLLNSRLPNSQLEFIEGGGHLCAYTQVDRVAELVADFMQLNADADYARTRR